MCVFVKGVSVVGQGRGMHDIVSEGVSGVGREELGDEFWG